MRKVMNFLLAGVFALLVAAPVAAVAVPTQASAGPACEASFLGIPPWYRGMTNDDCTIVSPDDLGGLSNFIWRIALNVIQMALVIVAYIAIFFILWGGFLFMTGGGNAAQVEKARKSILNAVVGLVIAMGAIAITNFLFGIIGNAGTTSGDISGLPTLTGEQILQNGLNTIYFIAGTIAVVMIIIGGIMYAISSGDAGKVTRAKNIITYSVVGLVIVLGAFAITNFVIRSFS